MVSKQSTSFECYDRHPEYPGSTYKLTKYGSYQHSTTGNPNTATCFNFSCYIQSTGKLAGTDSNGPEEVPKTTTAESDVHVNNQMNGASDDLSLARRGIPRVSGTYVEGHIEGGDLTYTVDTGASATILSTAILAEIPAERRPKIDTEKRPRFIGPTGSAIEILGKVKVKMTIGELEINREVSVANLHDECLLGADILLGLEEGPFDFFLSENKLSWNGFSIPCIQVKSAVPLKVMRAFKCTIAGHSEMLVDALVQSNEQNVTVSRTLHREDVLIEPDSNFCDRNRLMVAASLVQLGFTKVVKVRVMNPFPNDVEVQKGEVMAEATHFDQAIPLLNECDSTLGEGTEVARRLPMANERDDIDYLKQCNPDFHSTGELHSDLDTSLHGMPIHRAPTHLTDLYERTVCGIDYPMHGRVAKLLSDFSETFSKDDNDLGCTNLTSHTIDTGTTKPIKQAPRRTPLAFQGRDREALEKMLERGTIRESTSPWASPVVLVPKKDNSVRVCIDYRKINENTKKDAFPLPKINDCLDAVSGSAYFSTLDLTSGYNQVPVAKEDISKTAFVTKYGLFECPYMPFGLTNAPATFQRVMELALQGLQWTTCLIYIDDVIVFSKDADEHLSRLRAVLKRIQSANLKLKTDKCHLFQSEVLFLGHIISCDGIRPSPTNVDKILGWKTPQSTKQVRQFLGMATYYRRFIKDFAKIATPLSKLTGNVPFYWSNNCQKAFDSLKRALTGPDVMAYPLNEGLFVLDTDASGTAIGAVLSQIQGGQEKVVAYASRTLNKSEKNYCVTDKELLAVKHFIEYFYQYLMGRHFRVRTDHQALRWLFSFREPRGKIARWLELLSVYDFEIEYRKGTKNGNADALSRCENPRECQCDFEDEEQSALKCGPCSKCLKRSKEMVSEWQESSSSQQVRQVVDEHNGSAGVMQLTLFLSFFFMIGSMMSCHELGKRFTSYGLVSVVFVPFWRTWWKGPCGSPLFLGSLRGWFPHPSQLRKRFTSYGLVFVKFVPLWRTWWKGPCGSPLFLGSWRGWFPPPNHGFRGLTMVSYKDYSRRMVCCQLSLDGWKGGRGPWVEMFVQRVLKSGISGHIGII